jgi:hypothetical protein
MSKHVNVIVPDFFELDDLVVMKINVDQNNPKVALVIVGDNLSQTSKFKPTIRYYLAERTSEYFKVMKEVDAFVFNSNDEALEFVNNGAKNLDTQAFTTNQNNRLIFT